MMGYMAGFSPLEMARIAVGDGGFSPADIEEMEARIIDGQSQDAAMQAVLQRLCEEQNA